MSSNITSASLDSLLFLGVLNYSFKVGPYTIIYNLANVGETQETVNIYGAGEDNINASIMATSLTSVNGHTFVEKDGDTTDKKYRFLRALKRPVFNLFWNEYQTAVAIQFKNFEQFLSDAKKSAPIQPLETDGISSKD